MGTVKQLNAHKKRNRIFAIKAALTLVMVASCPVLFYFFDWYWSITPIVAMVVLYYLKEWRAIAFYAALIGIGFFLNTWFEWYIAFGIPAVFGIYASFKVWVFMLRYNREVDAKQKFLEDQRPKTFSERLKKTGELHNVMKKNPELFEEKEAEGSA